MNMTWRQWCVLASAVALISGFVFFQIGGPHRPTTMTALISGLICLDASVAVFVLALLAFQRYRRTSRNRR
jgi:ABC-type antimicrobial peptide transport system permease subunit